MEQTLGKRIAANRKRLGLTQEKMAEQLGVTAQAVSKWENDQACPDIAMLPKLAEIFGVSTDALLGIAPVHNETLPKAEVIPTRTERKEDQSGKGGWEFQWDGGRKGSLGFALLVLLVGGLLLAGNLLQWEVSFWGLLWPSAILIFGLIGLVPRFPFSRIVCTLVGAYFLLDTLDWLPTYLNSGLIFPVILVLLGISLLADTFRHGKKPVFKITHNGGNSEKTKCNCSTDIDSFHCDLSFGENTHFVSVPTLRSGEANLSFGELTVDLQGCATVSDNCCIEANCSFGELRFLVPAKFRVIHQNSAAFGSVTVSGHPDPVPMGVIQLDANTSFGEIAIEYV